MTNALTSTLDTPIGPFTVVTTDDDRPAVLASGWTGDLNHGTRVLQPDLRY